MEEPKGQKVVMRWRDALAVIAVASLIAAGFGWGYSFGKGHIPAPKEVAAITPSVEIVKDCRVFCVKYQAVGRRVVWVDSYFAANRGWRCQCRW